MRKLVLSAVLLAILAFPVLANEDVILDYALCVGLDQDGLPLERRDMFITEEEKILCWIFIDEVHRGDELRWEFQSPQGEIYESILVVEEDKQYVGATGELGLANYRNILSPGEWKVSFYLNGEKYLELPFTILQSNIEESETLEEAIQRTITALKGLGYEVLGISIDENDQACLRMNMISAELNEQLWNQIGIGFESLKRIFPQVSWFVVQLILDNEYALSFQVRAYDFDMWRKGNLNTDAFWKKSVYRYVYNLSKKEEIQDVSSFYLEKFGVIY
ncbi:MAG: hypothetical protein PWP57_750 [Candidatus Atribacteria bacterium]|nr:hypothetical protein [Candidatus Atribacteria bacterium]